MSDTAVEVHWESDQRFEAVGRSGVPTIVDGRNQTASSPMEALLTAVAACMGIDVVDILAKGRVPVEALTVRAEGDRRADPPRRFTAIRLVYQVAGVPDADRAKLRRAVDLSRDKYCSVLHTLQSDLDVSVRIDTD